MSTLLPPDHPASSLDHALLRRRFTRAAAHYDEADFLAREIARRMDERLDYICLAPRSILDLGCGTGADLVRLGERYPESARIGVDFAVPMLDRAHARTVPQRGGLRRLLRKTQAASVTLTAAEAAHLPLADASVSLIWSNLMLPAIDAPQPVFQEMQRVLEPGGLLMFSTLGPDTLRELRAALPQHGDTQRVHPFIDMHDLGDALLQAGFTDPVMDMEMLTLTYTSLDELFADLRATGANNAARNRPRSLSGRTGWNAARAHYETLRHDGRLPVSIEIIQGQAWKAVGARPPKPATTPDGRSVVQFHPRRHDACRPLPEGEGAKPAIPADAERSRGNAAVR